MEQAQGGPRLRGLALAAGGAQEVEFARKDLQRVRGMVELWAREHQLAGLRAQELVLAANELMANSIRHGGGRGTLRLWREGSGLLLEVRDGGRLADPLAGGAPGPGRLSGRGLWIVNRVCDQLRIRSSASGTAVQVHVRLEP